MPLIQQQLSADRGHGFKQQIRLLEKIYPGSIADLKDSIQPVLTKVSPFDSHFSIEDIRDNIQMQVDEVLVKQEIKRLDLPEDLEDESEMPEDISNIYDPQERSYEELKELFDQVQGFRNFCYGIGESIEVCDPLDRDILGSLEENQAIKVADLAKKICDLKPIPGRELSDPLDQRHYMKLLAMFQDQKRKIRVQGEKMLQMGDFAR